MIKIQNSACCGLKKLINETDVKRPNTLGCLQQYTSQNSKIVNILELSAPTPCQKKKIKVNPTQPHSKNNKIKSLHLSNVMSSFKPKIWVVAQMVALWNSHTVKQSMTTGFSGKWLKNSSITSPMSSWKITCRVCVDHDTVHLSYALAQIFMVQLRQPRIWCCHYLPQGSLIALGASESLSYNPVSFNLI